MASRPVFVPNYQDGRLVEERYFDFRWAPGFAEVQKKKNIQTLHQKARENGLGKVLEISSKSNAKVGQRLSAFSLKIEIDDEQYPLESVYQGSTVFDLNGPFPEIFTYSPREAKKFIRENQRGNIIAFELEGIRYPLSPKNAFYDWLYIRSLVDHVDWISENIDFDGFTDIEFNPSKQVNCQARAFAEFFSLRTKSQLERAAQDFSYFASLLSPV